MNETELLEWLATHIGFENYLHALERSIDRIRPEFTSFQAIIKSKKIKVVTIAGTNGKGETCHFLAQGLKEKRITYALWTSPHIISITERFEANGELISLGDLEQRVKKCKIKLDERRVKLSYFEFLFYIFLDWALAIEVEVLILEVGMGGRLDATNVLDAEVAAITSISRDHQEFLGNRYDEILKEKYGIVRHQAGQTLFTALELKYLRNLIGSWSIASDQQLLSLKWIELFETQVLQLSDSFSKRNKIMATSVLKHLYPEHFDKSFALKGDYNFIGRGDVANFSGKSFHFYGSHNLDGTRKLHKWLNEQTITFDIILSFSKRSIKDITHMLLAWIYWKYRHPSAKIYLTSFEHQKSFNLLEQFSTTAKRQQWPKKVQDALFLETFHLLHDWNHWISTQESNGRHANQILVTGSYYFVGEFKKWLQSAK
jgi:dihydrofolate synthase/folylpolyglutamate synthase